MSTVDFDPLTVAVRSAATVMIVRDGADGLEVFMLERTAAATFAAGMYVFPGGRVDAGDHGESMEPWCEGRTDADASAVLQLPSGGLAYWVAAIRECFEEAGVLLARHAEIGEVVSFADPHVAERFERYRRDVHGGHLALADLCAVEGLRLVTDSIGYVSHWITPIGQSRRFDTRFFVARAPEGQVPLHDDHETVASLWVRPADALERHAAGRLGMFAPTVENLRFLAGHATADDAVTAAEDLGGEVPAILPKVRVDGEGKVVEILHPGHPDFETAPVYAVVGRPE